MSNAVKVIAIDHGNRNIKTTRHTFPASYVESGHLPALGADTIVLGEKEYVLVDKRMPQKNDKTMDDAYFILTLFAIGKELAEEMDNPVGECVEITLLVGLPPLHCKKMGAGFAEYFKANGEPVTFTFNKLPFTISVKEVHVFPQAYAAAVTIYERVRDSRIINVVDIGGHTVDCMQLTEFTPDMATCTSLYGGVNSLFQRVNEQVRSSGAKDILDIVIEGILQNDEKTLRDCSPERVALVKSTAVQFARDMLLKVSQEGLDMSENTTVFIGGGSILLREYITTAGIAVKTMFVENVRANADGYQLIYQNRKNPKKKNG